ncbi:uncharacterized protein LOC108870843 [Brassica rapa]|uniref:uncharacterized protein LOC108870843 n=1 Tax=Brassica campestris TaxID=3711 RepID=UPI000871F0FC|nr:uncharacterized protein LOC108870843 [Brassica rapa]
MISPMSIPPSSASSSSSSSASQYTWSWLQRIRLLQFPELRSILSLLASFPPYTLTLSTRRDVELGYGDEYDDEEEDVKLFFWGGQNEWKSVALEVEDSRSSSVSCSACLSSGFLIVISQSYFLCNLHSSIMQVMSQSMK